MSDEKSSQELRTYLEKKINKTDLMRYHIVIEQVHLQSIQKEEMQNAYLYGLVDVPTP